MNDEITTVIAPAVGGIIVAYEVARLIKARSIFGEREDDVMRLRRGFEIAPDDRVLVVEDVVTTGGSVNEIIRLVQKAGAELKGVGFIVNRSQGKADFPVRMVSVMQMDVVTYTPEECPLCENNIPLVKPGSRKIM
jgi:orotate phosphoribosyltransferase